MMIRSIEFSINSETISILSGACYSVQDKGRFSLHNDISYPDYPSPKLFEDRSKDKLLKDSKLRSVIKEKFWRTRNVTNRVLVFVDVIWDTRDPVRAFFDVQALDIKGSRTP